MRIDEVLVRILDIAVVHHVAVEGLHVVGVRVHLELHGRHVVALAVRDVLDVLFGLSGVLHDLGDGARMVVLDVVERAQVGDLELDERRALLLEGGAVRTLAAAGELAAHELVGTEGDGALAALRGHVAVAAVH